MPFKGTFVSAIASNPATFGEYPDGTNWRAKSRGWLAIFAIPPKRSLFTAYISYHYIKIQLAESSRNKILFSEKVTAQI